MLSQQVPRILLYLITGRGQLENVDKSDPTAIFQVTKQTFHNWPDDFDFNLHMNNAYPPRKPARETNLHRSYHKIQDIKRAAHNHGLAPNAALKTITRNLHLGHSGTSARYIREIPMF